ncbi:hypothetical protein GCK72_013364 [Caenorhabditis remanei]|uniref:Uncharacterized protein n=1 Tax=Caenorhabditis remanei TaxID=31234 RepID=A0A6A5GNL7_CAERE|nr:hypothetical protein GCK72_013364 [Caenorhabditis remanei]KAF1756910.1 hypothetical protein GCK72_013364 [Caenorhabditis remanei]
MSVDSVLVDSFVQLTNHFATVFSDTESISSMTDLWEKQGGFIAKIMKCDTKEFRNSDLFYEVLHRKMNMVNGSLVEALDPKAAAKGNLLEICKFYALFLEFLRKDHSELLTNVLEKLATEIGFNSTVLLDMFVYFDKLYSQDSVDDWWSFLIRPENVEVLSGMRTPPRNNFINSTFVTPTATARRLRTASSTARRSPIADAVDSPTMKFMRIELQLKQAQRQMLEAEQHVEELEQENGKLKTESRANKIAIDSLKQEVAGKRDNAELAEERVQKMTAEMESKQLEVEAVTKQLAESRTTLRSEQRHLEELEKEKEKLASKLATTTESLEKCMKEMRKLRDTNEMEFQGYQKKESDLEEQLRSVLEENRSMADHLTSLEELKANLHGENKRLTSTVESLSLESARNRQEADNAKTEMGEQRERFQAQLEKCQQDHTERAKMADSKIERLQNELDAAKSDKNGMEKVLGELKEQVLNTDMANHQNSEGFLSAKACLEGAKKKIEELQVDVKGKESMNLVLSQQLERTKDILRNEQLIRDASTAQFNDRYSKLQNVLEEKKKEIELLRENMENIVLKHQNEAAQHESEMKECREQNEKLIDQLESMTTIKSEVEQKKCYLEERIKLFQEDPPSPIERCDTPDSLVEYLSKEGPLETEEELRRNVEQTPRKSIAFNFDMNSIDSIRGTPIGFKSNPRESICSNYDLFERCSTARSSMRSDTNTLASTSEFKPPFTPSGTTKERIGILTSRNEKVKPHLQSSYVVEMADVNSPSADEENVRKGGGVEKKKRRNSIFAFKKN